MLQPNPTSIPCFQNHKDDISQCCRKYLDHKHHPEENTTLPVIPNQEVPNHEIGLVPVGFFNPFGGDSMPQNMEEAHPITRLDMDLFRNCHLDRLKLCPGLPPPFTASILFNAPCITDNIKNMSRECRRMRNQFVKGSRHFEVHVNIKVIGACTKDKANLCSNEHIGRTPKELFTNKCIIDNVSKLTIPCRMAYGIYKAIESSKVVSVQALGTVEDDPSINLQYEPHHRLHVPSLHFRSRI
eukprot:Ihof_evm6s84 gene=Ihof_evmTU6s84